MSEQRKWILGLVAAFLFGVAGGTVGALGAVAFLHHRGGPPHFAAGGPAFDHGRPHERGGERGGRGGTVKRVMRRPSMERMVTEHLDLSDAQRTTIEGILDSARPRYAAVRESTHLQIERVLTPGQRAKLKEFEDRFPTPPRDGRDGRDDRGRPDAP